MVPPKDIVRHELIGLELRISDSADKSIVGVKGRVVDESRNMLVVDTEKGEKRLVKEQCIFSFHLPSGEWVRVDGKLLVARPEDRIKKKLKKW